MFNKKRFKLMCFGLALLFVVTFCLRTVYEYTNPQAFYGLNRIDNYTGNTLSRSEDSLGVKNYATMKMDYDVTGEPMQVIDQKYEKIADINTVSKKYEEDEAALYSIIDKNKCVVQMENKSGLPGDRHAQLIIGVKPDHFDKTVKDLAAIGEITSQNITKTDKTAQYRQMLADKATIEKTKESYMALRAKGGTITELLALEDKIIEVEAQIQKQSVDLGDYSDDNSFCTVNFTLSENRETPGINISSVLWSSLTWTFGIYLALLAIISCTCITGILLALLFELIKKLIAKYSKTAENK